MAASTGTAAIGAAPFGAEPGGAIDELRRRGLRIPIEGVDVDALRGAFNEQRAGEGGHTHEAVDLLAPRHTPVRAIEGGTIAKLFDSRAGGHTIYQLDPTGRFAYYYAHLDAYQPGLAEGASIAGGDTLGFVGTTGNAPKDTPHLHFQVMRMPPDGKYWDGEAINPYPLFLLMNAARP